jgi:cytochrome c oxidase cbb3-type subunit III
MHTMKNYKLIMSVLMSVGTITMGWGQTAGAATAPTVDHQFPQIMTAILVIAVALIVSVALWAMVRANIYLTKHLLRLEAERNGIVLPEETYELKGSDFWTTIKKKFWEDPVPREREGEFIFQHAYDGIQELDNHLPPWWINLFVVTVIWAGGYMWYYHWGGGGPSSEETYKTSVEVAKKEIAIALAGKANAVDETTATAMTEPAALAAGETIFKELCAACHGQKGEGGVGPNMTDEYWIHGGSIKNIFKTVKLGVPEKGMIAWSSQLKPVEIQQVSSYILTLKGTNPPNAKEPQGELWKGDNLSSTDTIPKK